MKAEDLRPLMMLNLALAVICALFLVLMVLALVRDPQVAIPAVQGSASPRQVLAWNWFPVSPVSPEMPAETAAEDYDELNIRGELLGVIIAPGGSTATIRINGQEQVYSPGDEIQPGIEVTRVEPTRVVVTQRGRPFQISFPEPEQRTTVSRTAASGPTQTPVAGSGSLEAFQLPNVLNAEPVEVEGYNAGYRLSSIATQISAQADIRNGDVVVKVGDLDLQSLMSNPAQWVNLTTETTLPVTVIRDGREEIVYVNALALSARLLPNLKSN